MMDNNHPANCLIIVSGQPRSGTSLMMRILATSGIQPIADEHVSYETPRIQDMKKGRWVERLPNGVCLKALFPYVYELPFKTRILKIIWMYRNPKEQARSQRRFMGAPRKWLPQQVERIKGYEKEIPPLLEKLCPVLQVSFDKLITNLDLKPVEEFLGIPLLPDSIKTRSPRGNIYKLGELERLKVAQSSIRQINAGVRAG